MTGKYGLKRIIQIDGFIPGIRKPVFVDDHAILNGTNGAGKSSTLKLLALFYGSDPSQLDSHAAGRDPFVQFYLPRQTSIIIFEYQRENGLCCAVVYRHKNGSKHVYRFLEGGFTEDRFSRVDDSGKTVYCKGYELKFHWQQMSLNCSSQIEVVTDYRAIIQNDTQLINRLADSKSLRRNASMFCLGSRTTHMRYIDRICAAIISRSGNMERMKDMLADIMMEDGIIFPTKPIHPSDEALAKEIKSLREFEKGMPKMRDVLNRHYQRLDIETRLSHYAVQVERLLGQIVTDIGKSDDKLTEIRDQIDALRIEFESEYRALDKQRTSAENKADECEKQIDDLYETHERYENEDMEQKAADVDNVGAFIETSEQAKQRYLKLNEEVQEEEGQLNRNMNAESERFERSRAKIQDKLNEAGRVKEEKEKEYNNQRETIMAEENAEIEAYRQTVLPEQHALIEAMATAKANADHSGPTDEELLTLTDLENRIDQQKIAVTVCEKKLEEKTRLVSAGKQARDAASEQLNRASRDLSQEREELEALHKIAFSGDGTWLEKLRTKDPRWIERLGKVVNPDLLQRTDLSAEFSEEDIESLFGWSVNLNVISTPAYAEKEEQLRADYFAKEESVKLAEGIESECKSKLSKEQSKVTEAEKELATGKRELDNEKTRKADAENVYWLKNGEIKEAVGERRNQKKQEFKRLEKENSDLKKEIVEQEQKIRERRREELSELQSAWWMDESRLNQDKDRLKGEIADLIESSKRRKKQLQDDFNQACSAKGINAKTIEEARETSRAAEQKVQDIRESVTVVDSYKDWLKLKWSGLNELQSQLVGFKAEHQKIDDAIKNKERQLDKKRAKLEEQRKSETKILFSLKQKREDLDGLSKSLAGYPRPENLVKEDLSFEILIQETQTLLASNESMKERLRNDIDGINSKIMSFDETQIGQAWRLSKDQLREQLGFEDESDAKFKLNLPQALEELLDDNFGHIKTARIESLRGVGKGLNDFFEKLSFIHKRIREQSRKITSAISQNMKIDALSSMGIELTSRIDELDYWKPLQEFARSWDSWRETGQHELPDQNFLEDMSLLIEALKTIKSGGQLRDYFDLHIKMVENDNERIIKNDHQLDNSTSDGLKYLALCVIYIAISRLLCPDRQVLLHWPIDELGILHGDNISKLFGMLNDGGIIMVGGFPSEDPVMLRHFKHRQVIDFKTGIRAIDIPESSLKERALMLKKEGSAA